MIKNNQVLASLLLRAAQITSRDDLRESLVDEAMELIGYMNGTIEGVTCGGGVALADANNMILHILDDGARAISDIDKECMKAGVSATTLQRAKTDLHKNHLIRTWSKGFGDNHRWYMEKV